MVFHVSESEWVIGSAQPVTASRRLPFGLGRLADERLAQLVSAGRERAFAVLYVVAAAHLLGSEGGTGTSTSTPAPTHTG